VLTRSGLAAATAAIVLGAAGWWWHYEELVVLAVGIAALVMMAIWGAQRPFRADVRRNVDSPRVARGDPVTLTYRVANDSGHRAGRASIIDRCDDATVEVHVDPLAPGEALVLQGALPTRRRGVFDVGPWSIERVDPFGLAVGRRLADRRTPVLVHPRLYPLVGPLGAMHTVETEARIRRMSSDPLSGFVSLRDYVPGDDPRLIHWPTTARTGTLMVREHVEVRRPEFTVVLDTSPKVATPDELEEMVDVAASIAVHAVRTGRGVVVRTTDKGHAGRPAALTTEAQVLDLLTPVQQSSPEELLSVASLFAGGLERSAVIVVTGPGGPSSQVRASERAISVRIGHGAQLSPGVVLAVEDATEFAERWRPWA
jgi:uncharacterized protein (DUF58 family)